MFRKYDADTYRELRPGVQMQMLCWGALTSMGRFLLSRGSNLPLHAHPHEQTGYLVTGHMIFTIDGVEYETTAGDAWCIPGHVEHAVEVLEDSVIVEVFSPVREDYLPR